jgi:carbonic anhydrase
LKSKSNFLRPLDRVLLGVLLPAQTKGKQMNKNKIARYAVALSLGVALIGGATAATAAASWTYSGPTGANHWGTLDASYATCVDGSAQTPINIVKTKKAKLKNLAFSYATGEAGIFNNGHTVEAEPLTAPANTSSVSISGVSYNFLQFHFHAPSEHEINGMHYPLEIHFVNKSADGKLAVVGVFVKRGAANEAWQPFIDNMLKATATAEDTKVELDWAAMLPAAKTTLRYDGSLTTPPCSEGVKWNIFNHAITMSAAQINTFLEAYSGNNRPVQPTNGRVVYLDTTAKN